MCDDNPTWKSYELSLVNSTSGSTNATCTSTNATCIDLIILLCDYCYKNHTSDLYRLKLEPWTNDSKYHHACRCRCKYK